MFVFVCSFVFVSVCARAGESDCPDGHDRWAGSGSACSLCHLRSNRAGCVCVGPASMLTSHPSDRSHFVLIHVPAPKKRVTGNAKLFCTLQQKNESSEAQSK